jgi:hypothetical protein
LIALGVHVLKVNRGRLWRGWIGKQDCRRW